MTGLPFHHSATASCLEILPQVKEKVIIRQEIYSTRLHQIKVLFRMQKKIQRKGIPHHRAVASSACSHATRANARVSSLSSHRRVSALLIYSRDLGQTVFLFRRRTASRWKGQPEDGELVQVSWLNTFMTRVDRLTRHCSFQRAN